jgi:diaminopimelate decarboxylase
MSIPDAIPGRVDLDEAARQLQLAMHDTRVAFDCVSLGELDRAHTHAITARAAVDAAENVLRAALADGADPGGQSG